MAVIEQLILSFIATAAFGILFNAPRSMLIKCGFVGMFGWTIYYLIERDTSNGVGATLVAAFVVGIISHMLAKSSRTPVIVFSVSGMIPLVPGGMAYNAMRHFVEIDYSTAMSLAGRASLMSGAIAMGLVFSEALNHIHRSIRTIRK
ncbi:threonine/serine exporter [Neobacillus notoginsengisoli]|uniref:Threonine/serine exporter n=1 Tax=Neobacillus notoginsengisoli TaxID=1578198 RepID=A0A417YW61_9BACI|nr:threonine/serine exporter family protein [Neobacillus notoginsengisoli]RHW41491.1 threonine/serine exporter [Neobacillus notoginsengisoli]